MPAAVKITRNNFNDSMISLGQTGSMLGEKWQVASEEDPTETEKVNITLELSVEPNGKVKNKKPQRELLMANAPLDTGFLNMTTGSLYKG